MKLSNTEENYLKAIYHLSKNGEDSVSTNSISDSMKTSAASVTDMIKKLAAKDLLLYKKYQGVTISQEGILAALKLIRKHRLWESFLVTKLHFKWDEVHEVAEQLEHIKSPLLISRLDEFLGHPRVDPHGDPIPTEKGEIPHTKKVPLSDWDGNDTASISGVKDTSPQFLQYLDKVGIQIGASVQIVEKVEFDGSLEIRINDEKNLFISETVSKNLLIS